MKQNRTFIFIMLLLAILGLSACSSQKQQLVGKYIDIYDEDHYLNFNEDGSFIDNFLTTSNKGNTTISDFYAYQIDNNGLITIIDTTEYEGQDTLDKYELGILYKSYIGVKWDGILPINDNDVSIINELGDLTLTYNFEDDKSYEYTVTFNNEIVYAEYGTYTVSDNKVVCTSEDGVTTTFINVEGEVLLLQYVKE